MGLAVTCFGGEVGGQIAAPEHIAISHGAFGRKSDRRGAGTSGRLALPPDLFFHERPEPFLAIRDLFVLAPVELHQILRLFDGQFEPAHRLGGTLELLGPRLIPEGKHHHLPDLPILLGPLPLVPERPQTERNVGVFPLTHRIEERFVPGQPCQHPRLDLRVVGRYELEPLRGCNVAAEVNPRHGAAVHVEDVQPLPARVAPGVRSEILEPVGAPSDLPVAEFGGEVLVGEVILGRKDDPLAEGDEFLQEGVDRVPLSHGADKGGAVTVFFEPRLCRRTGFRPGRGNREPVLDALLGHGFG